jgi:hypothetical protein
VMPKSSKFLKSKADLFSSIRKGTSASIIPRYPQTAPY